MNDTPMHNALFPNRRSEDFGRLLAQYVFCVADAFIDQADPETQQKLISLFVKAGNGPEPDHEAINQNDIH